jgi:hypothetical protein
MLGMTPHSSLTGSIADEQRNLKERLPFLDFCDSDGGTASPSIPRVALLDPPG